MYTKRSVSPYFGVSILLTTISNYFVDAYIQVLVFMQKFFVFFNEFVIFPVYLFGLNLEF